uniref:glucan endo-1,3-beta-D-glucosidase n=1 Tax=Kalanchoe fedtschenkoi TaxID=63787 RepID=A0A7N0SWN8_KALFE
MLLKMPDRTMPLLLILAAIAADGFVGVSGIGANWGTQASHPLPAEIVVQLLKDNGITKVKLFDADYHNLRLLGNTGIEVMVGIPNDKLNSLANSQKAADKWVSENVTSHIFNVDIRYVAVGNEPFLSTYNGSFLRTTFPAIRNIQTALSKAGLTNRVKVTCPLNADVYESGSNLPSGGDFRADIRDLMINIVKFLSDNGAPFTVNIYPFISLYLDENFPVDYAFFDGFSSPIVDGGLTYENVFDANYDTLVSALTKNGFGNVPIIVGEVGWPTDGDKNATPTLARRFNQGFMTRVIAGKGTPLRPTQPVEAYLFSLIDEDDKSIQPGNFERHWGVFNFDGSLKYQLNLGTATNSNSSGGLVPARGVQYLSQKWCIMSPSANLDNPRIAPTVSYACALADCTSLGYQTSCSGLDARGNISYAYNSYYQKANQQAEACKFDGLGTVTTQNPSQGSCNFTIMIQPDYDNGADSFISVHLWLGSAMSMLLLLLVL